MMKLNVNKLKKAQILSHVIMILWSLVVLVPIWILIINSFKTRLTIYNNPVGLPKEWNFSNYAEIINDSNFVRYFFNTLTVVSLSEAGVLILSILAGYAFSNWTTKKADLLFFFMIAGMMLPIKIASIKLLELMKTFGLLNNLLSLILIYIAMGIPVGVFILTEFFKELPRELFEAGLIDGAKHSHILFFLLLPLLRPAIATVAIYNLIPFWNDLWFPLIFINDDNAKTLLLGVTRLFGQYQTDWSKVLAVLTLSAIPVLLFYLSISKQFIKGVTAGAVKG